MSNSTKPLYVISNWDRHYENSRSRIVQKLEWVPVPNRHDGDAYSSIIGGKNGAEIFAAWILMLQVASKCQPRGDLVRTNGEPHNPESLALKTRAPAVWFEKAIPELVKWGWICCNPLQLNQTAPAYQATDVPAALAYHPSADGMEWKRMEGNGNIPPSAGRKRNPLFDALASGCGLDPHQMTDADCRACAVALASVRKVLPEVTVEEIARRCANWVSYYPRIAATPSAIGKHWAQMDNEFTPTNPNQTRAPTKADYDKGFFHGIGNEPKT